MEDSFHVEKDLFGDGQMSYYAVFDGHGGTKASAYAANRMHLDLKGELGVL